MRPEVASDLEASAECFNRLVAPVLERRFQGSIRRTESATAEGIEAELDMLAGIDGWHVLHSRGRMRGIASRIQPCDQSWDTFTVRETRSSGQETELAKRIAALKDQARGWILPALTTHAYVSQDRLSMLSLGVVLTADLYHYIDGVTPGKRGSGLWRQTNREDGNTFLCVPWWALREAKARIWTWVGVAP